MGESSERGASRRYPRIIAGLLVTLALVGCGGLGLLPYQNDIRTSGFDSLSALKTAYRAITPGATRASDLSGLGFDATSAPNVKVLSYLGVMERFMPRDSVRFDKLAPAVQACIDARDHCTAYVFQSRGQHEAGSGSAFAGLLGIGRAAAAARGWTAEVVLLVQDGRVAYKAISGGAGHAIGMNPGA